MKTILITGGDGFIGKKLTKSFLDLGCYVYTLSNLKSETFIKNHSHILHDIQLPFDNLEFDHKIDVVIHAAAFIPKDMNDDLLAQKCLLINSIGTLNALKFSESHHISHFIYLTSANSYKYSTDAVTEKSCLDPSSRATYYLSSKIVGEFYVNHFTEKNILKTTIFRLSTVYGEGSNDFINRAIESIQNDKIFEIYNQNYTTDFIYVDDIVEIINIAFFKQIYGVYNLSSGKSSNLLDVLNLICDVCNKDKKKLINITYKLNDKGFASISNRKTKLDFNYSMTELEVGVKRIINHRKNTI